jgi:hypothetical protein
MATTTTPTTPTTHRLTVTDSREERLNGAPPLRAEYDFPTAEDAYLLGGLLLQQDIEAPGRWRRPIAGGVREVTIAELTDTDQ